MTIIVVTTMVMTKVVHGQYREGIDWWWSSMRDGYVDWIEC